MAKSTNGGKRKTDDILRDRFNEVGDEIAAREKSIEGLKAERQKLCEQHEKFYLEKIKPLNDKIHAVERTPEHLELKGEHARIARALPGARSTSDNLA